jgi:hypothetical protein
VVTDKSVLKESGNEVTQGLIFTNFKISSDKIDLKNEITELITLTT